MPSLKELRTQIKSLDGTSRVLTRGEIKELPDILWKDESIENIVQGFYSNGKGILVATNKRLVFVNKKFLSGVKVEDFPYEKISSIQYETGLLDGKITIFTSGNRLEITRIEKKQTRIFSEAVCARITKSAESDRALSTAPSIGDDDVLEKPYALKVFRSLSWFFGVIFLLVGLAYTLSEDGTTGIAMLAVAGLLLPPVRDWVHGITGISIPARIKGLSILILLMYGGLNSSVPTDTQTSAHKQKVENQTMPQPETAWAHDDETGAKTKPPAKVGQAEPVPAAQQKSVPKFKDFKIVKEEDISTALRSRFKIEVEAPNADTDRKVIEALMLALVEVHRKEWPQVVTGFLYDSSGRDELANNRLTYAPDGCAWTGEDCTGELWSGLMDGVLPDDLRRWGKPTEEETEAGRDAACRFNLQCWGRKHEAKAVLNCQLLIESMAKYTYEWTDGILESKFPRFAWGDRKSRTLIYMGDKIRFQNVFGAWQNMSYKCEFDPIKETVEAEVY